MASDRKHAPGRRKKRRAAKHTGGMGTTTKHYDVTPVDRAFYESIILHDRWNVGKLYANNIFDGQNYRKQVRNMAQERANELFGMDQEIEDMKQRIEKIIIQRENLKYLPTEKEIATNRRLENERNKRGIRVIPDPRNQSVVILPPIYKTVPGRKQKQQEPNRKPVNYNQKKKKPLHLAKSKTTRRHRFKEEYENDTASMMASAPTSVVTSYPDSVRTYYPSKESSTLFRDSPFKYGALYGKSSFQFNNNNTNSDITGTRRSNYNKDFYNEEDFKSTQAKYIPRSMRTSHEYGVNFLAS